MTTSDKKIWAAVSLKPNQANKAETNLKRQGIDYLAPKIRVTKRQQNRFIDKINLFFPGYIFVHIDLNSDDCRKVNSTYGISHIVKVRDQIGRIPDEFIETINSTFEGVNDLCISALKPGDNVEIVRGPFAGLIAEIIRTDSASRLKCLFSLLEGKVGVSINSEDVILV